MDKIIVLVALVYIAGFMLSFLMLKTEHLSEGQTYTIGNRLLNVVFSLLSFIMVIVILISAWCKMIAGRGYWNQPVKGKNE